MHTRTVVTTLAATLLAVPMALIGPAQATGGHVSPSPAAAGATRPVVMSWHASKTTLPSAGGTVTLTGKVSHATSCRISASPPAPGLPKTKSCGSGAVGLTVHLPKDVYQTATHYRLVITASDRAGHSAAKGVTVTVSGTRYLTGVASVVGDDVGMNYCAVLVAGGVDCWGYDANGQLGDGSDQVQFHSRPVSVRGVRGHGRLTGVKSVVSADGYTFCALLKSGRVDCWGQGSLGELGNGHLTAYARYPVQVHGVGNTRKLSGVVSMVANNTTYCALLGTGRVDCWGRGADGALGNHATADRATPVAVHGVGNSAALTSVSKLVAVPAEVIYASSSFCGLLRSGQVDCWGSNTDGQLGVGTTNDSTVPVAVRGIGGAGRLNDVTSLSAGYQSVCARLGSGKADCWGSNGGGGNLGNGSSGPDSCGGSPCATTPTAVVADAGLAPLTGVRLVVNGGSDSSNCALMTSGQVRCWGQGGDGQLGYGAGYSSDVPVTVNGVGGVGTLGQATGLVSSGDGYCAVLRSKHLDCWGLDEVGQTGNGQASQPQTCFFPGTEPCWQSPVAVLGLHARGLLPDVTAVSSNTSGYCAVLTSHRVDCWGYNDVGQLGVATSTGPDSCYGNVCAASPAAVRSVVR